jgi:hypothetical protein
MEQRIAGEDEAMCPQRSSFPALPEPETLSENDAQRCAEMMKERAATQFEKLRVEAEQRYATLPSLVTLMCFATASMRTAAVSPIVNEGKVQLVLRELCSLCYATRCVVTALRVANVRQLWLNRVILGIENAHDYPVMASLQIIFDELSEAVHAIAKVAPRAAHVPERMRVNIECLEDVLTRWQSRLRSPSHATFTCDSESFSKQRQASPRT